MTGIDHLDPPSPAALRFDAPVEPGAAGCSSTAPVPSAAARVVFGERLTVAQRYARLLVTDGIDHGLIGPREVARIWDRHLVNCALVTDLVPPGSRVVDVGSGAGLPGLAMAIRRPDLRVDLLESMQRRVRFLSDAVSVLDLDATVRVVRGRAESLESKKLVGSADWVVARAVARLDRLVEWCAPLLAPQGTLLALKGESAESELSDCADALGRRGMSGTVRQLSASDESEPTWVVSVRKRAATRTNSRGGRA